MSIQDDIQKILGESGFTSIGVVALSPDGESVLSFWRTETAARRHKLQLYGELHILSQTIIGDVNGEYDQISDETDVKDSNN